MKIKNLKINKKRIKALIGAIILSTNLTACSFTQSGTMSSDKETYTSENSILNDKNVKYLVVTENKNEKLVPIENLRLIDDKNQVVEKVNGVIVNGKIMHIENPVEIKFSKDIEEVVVGYDIVSASEFSLINGETGDKITNIVGMYNMDYEFVDYDDKYLENNTTNKEEKEDNECTKEEKVYEYEELTSEKFYALADEIYKKYSEIGLDVSKEEVIDFMMMVNIDKIAKDNQELVAEIVGDRNTDTVILNMMDVYSAIKTKNDNNYCSKGLGFDSLILVNDTIFDEETKDKVKDFEGRIREIFEARNSKDKFNELLNKLLNEVLNATEEEFNMENGAGYSSMEILIYFIRSNFEKDMNKENAELIKYFCNYAEDFGTEYYENSRSTAYYSGIYYLLTDNVACVKTRTK